MLSPFVDEKYTADRNIVNHYHDLTANYLALKRNEDVDKIKEVLKRNITPNNGEYKDRRMKALIKNKFGDRELKTVTTSQYFHEVQKNNYHLSPSMVAYKNTLEEQSVNAIGTEFGLQQRSLYKAKRQQAEREGDKWGVLTNDAIQNALKIFNNAQSGAMSSSGTPLANKSGHTTLTSVCRALTSTANVCNERLIAGNRLYNSYQRTMECILSTIIYSDLVKMEKVVKDFNMDYATVEQVYDMIRRCSGKYWKNEKRLKDIKEFLFKLSPIQLTAVLCSLDLYGLLACNPKVVKEFISDFSKIPEIPKDAKAEDYPKPDNGDRYTLCVSKLMLKEPTPLQINHLNDWHLKCEIKWKEFIEVFLKINVAPPGIYDITTMIRDVIQTSDTDSSIYSDDLLVDQLTDDWDESLRINGVLTYFIRMISIHQHKQLSKNMNVAEKYLHRLNMKNEFLFGSYVTTIMSKHYFATQLMVEGVLKDKPKIEVKGVHLRSSKIAKMIKDFSMSLMVEVLTAIQNKTKLDAADILKRVGDIERSVIKDMNDGKPNWLTKETIKIGKVYSKPLSTVYFYHLLWEEVFASKYGAAPELPYTAIKINAICSTGKKTKEYIDSLEDKELAQRLSDFLSKYKKDDINNFYVPHEILKNIERIPTEIIQAADIRSIIKQNLKSVYAVLESMGIFIVNEKITKLISDEH